jgi:uncharacterized protein YbjT (DUF2867 family)
VTGDALDAATFAYAIPRGATLVPPRRHAASQSVEGRRVRARRSRIDPRERDRGAWRSRRAHIVYLSVARPAPLMRSYIAARERGEAAVAATGIAHTFVRPWYVLGPGHYGPTCWCRSTRSRGLFPPTREQAVRLGLVTLRQMVTALVAAVETPPRGGVRIVDVPAIARAALD